MNCDICHRAHHPAKLPFLCVVDARNALYPSRLSSAQVLIESENLQSRINQLLSDSDAASSSARQPDRTSRLHIEKCASEEHKAREKTLQIIASADRLRDEVAAAKRQIGERRARIARQKADLAMVSSGVEARRKRELEETKTTIRMTKYNWDREYEGLTQYRAALCLEVAKLYRLQRVKRGGPARYDYRIGGIDIIDLHQMNTASPELISASLGNISHLLWLTSHYLAIRLPAEITLPHNDYPRPTIFSLVSSYHHGNVAFPGSSPLPPDPLDRQFQHVPHPRPLYIDRSLAAISKEDPPSYNAFMEAVSLLAYNIVWLCRTQGVPVGNDLEDFASIGRNMYNLLIVSPTQRNEQQQHVLDPAPDRAGEGSEHTDLGKTAPRTGLYSHGTLHTSLATAAGNRLTRSFPSKNPVKLADELKNRLTQEMYPTAEWELVASDGSVLDGFEDAVMVGGTSTERKNGSNNSASGDSSSMRYGLESYMSVHGAGGSSVAPPREKSHGWTKIKSRTPG